jgi:hypothetical protein
LDIIDVPSDHKTQENFIHYFPVKKICHSPEKLAFLAKAFAFVA